jgi:predicted secreted protein
MSTSFNDWADEVEARAATEAAAGDDTRSRLSAAFAAHYSDERRRLTLATKAAPSASDTSRSSGTSG